MHTWDNIHMGRRAQAYLKREIGAQRADNRLKYAIGIYKT